MSQFYRQAHYIISATQLSELPPDIGLEVAFAGRSNAGKSSAINTITDHKALARISKTPGRTQMINFFALDDSRTLVDLPGYGYAKVPEQMKIRWQQNLGQYLDTRQSLQGLMIMMDIRHPLKQFDIQMIRWSNQKDLDVHILLTKSDKLKHGAAMATLHSVLAEIKKLELNASAQLFSSLKKTGRDEATAKLDSWFLLNEPSPEPEPTSE
jgi:GTP-binding protein